MDEARFNVDKYLIRRKVLKFVGASFHVYNSEGRLEFYVNQKGFKLKEDIRVFTGEDMTQEILSIRARNVVDFSGTYDVYDSMTGERLGSLWRRGIKAIFKDEWIINDVNDREIGVIKEDSTGLALLRRFITGLIPQGFVGRVNGQEVLRFKQMFNPFISKMNLDFSMDVEKRLDRRMGIAAGILLSAIEGRQK